MLSNNLSAPHVQAVQLRKLRFERAFGLIYVQAVAHVLNGIK
jgi:hypothetical protein